MENARLTLESFEKRVWKQDLTAAIQEAGTYRFLRLVSEEGAAVNELLRKFKKEGLAQETVDTQWFERVLKETADMTVRYPVYLKRQLSAALDFPENVRYHTKENYRKLGVSGKADAVLAARALNLL